MVNWKSTAAVSGAGLLLTWLANGPAQQGAVAPARTATRPAAARAGSDIQEQAERLRARMHASAAYSEPSRNPFRFRVKHASIAPVRTVAPENVVAALPPPPPSIKLSGIAADTVDGQEQRTAILNTPGGLVFAHEGDDVAGQFRVSSISEDAVELIGPDGVVLRLR
jgi:hypothetical protein